MSYNDNIETNEKYLYLSISKIVANACKFTEEGTVHMHCAADKDNSKLIISVADTGPGIPKNMAEVVFDKFVKLDSFIPGTGLGLTTCRYLLKKIGGTVNLDTEYDKGCKFVITIPYNYGE